VNERWLCLRPPNQLEAHAGMERWIGFGVLAHNLRQISNSLAMQAAS